MRRELSPTVVFTLAGLAVILLVGSLFLWERQKQRAQSEQIEATIRAGAGPPQEKR